MNIYFIPGIGADKKIFKHVRVPAGCKPVYLEWITPLVDESLRDYAYRLAENIDITKPFIVVGLSFGGMLGAEIIERYRNGKLVLISSVLSAEKLPSYYKVAGRLRMHRLIPVSLLKSASLMKRLFTAETPEQKAYLKKTIREIDNSFIKWALNAVVTWNGKISDVPYVHIHGSNDFILPVRFCNPTHVIKGAGHLMILTKTNEINKILEEYIRSSYPRHT